MTRVYCPVSENQLRAVVETGELPAGVAGFAATPAVARELVDLPEEELEYALASAAAEAAGQLLLDAGVQSGRRFVVVAELPERAVRTDDDDAGAITATAPMSRRQVVAVLADPQARLLTSAETDLGWFATQELPDLLA